MIDIIKKIIDFIEYRPVLFGGLFLIIGSIITVLSKSIYKKIINKNKISKSSNIFQENVGGDKIEIHNHYGKEIGIGNQSDVFNEKLSTLPTKEEILDAGYSMIDISQEDLNYIGEMFNKIFVKNNLSRNGLSMVRGAVFALGSKDYDNKEWREQCSSSIRELLHEWKQAHPISRAFRSVNDKTIIFPEPKGLDLNVYQKMEYLYAYFSSTCHHYNTRATYSLRKIMEDDALKDSDNNDIVFIKVVNSFFSITLSFINKAVVK